MDGWIFIRRTTGSEHIYTSIYYLHIYSALQEIMVLALPKFVKFLQQTITSRIHSKCLCTSLNDITRIPQPTQAPHWSGQCWGPYSLICIPSATDNGYAMTVLCDHITMRTPPHNERKACMQMGMQWAGLTINCESAYTAICVTKKFTSLFSLVSLCHMNYVNNINGGI